MRLSQFGPTHSTSPRPRWCSGRSRMIALQTDCKAFESEWRHEHHDNDTDRD